MVGSASSILGNLNTIEIRGDYAYTGASSNMQVFNISDPENPVWVSLYDTNIESINDIETRGNYMYVTDGLYMQASNLKIFDLSDPENPSLSSILSLGAIVNRLSLSGDYAYITDAMPDNGLYAVNINPDSGSFLEKYGPCDSQPGGGTSEGVAAFGSYAFVTDKTLHHNSLTVIDISDPVSLSDSSFITNTDWGDGQASQIIISGNYAYVTDESASPTGGLKIFELIP